MAGPARSRALALVLVAMILAASLAAVPGVNAAASGEAHGIVEMLAEKALQNVTDARERYYLEWLSARTIIINASRIPWLVGRDTGSFCMLAYYNGDWHDVIFVPFDDMAIVGGKPLKRVVLGTVSRIGPNTKILIKLPVHAPQPADPRREVPAPARGAKLWGWLNVSSGGYTYPILIVADGPQVNEMCGGIIPGLYHDKAYIVNGTIIMGGGGAYLLQYAIRYGIETSPRLLQELYKPPRDLRVEPSFPIRRPLPDGGGTIGSKDLVMWSQPAINLSSKNGYYYWKEIVFSVKCDSSGGVYRDFYVYPLSSDAGIDLNNVKIKKISVFISGMPKKESGNPTFIQAFSGTIKLEAQNYQASNSFILIGMLDPPMAGTDTVTFNISKSNPYGIRPTRIHVVMTGTCSQGVRWNISFMFTFLVELRNYNFYYNNKFLFRTSYYLIHDNSGYPIAEVMIPAGRTESDPSAAIIPLSTPAGIAFSSSKSTLASWIPLKIVLPPGYPGGILGFYGLPGVYNFVVGLPSNPGTLPKVYTTRVFIHLSSNRSEAIQLVSQPLWIAYVKASISEPASKHYIIKVYIDDKNATAEYVPFKLVSLPIVPVENPDANNPLHASLTPITNHSYVLNSDPLLDQVYVRRLQASINQISKISYYSRIASSAVSVSARGSNLLLEFSVSPKDYEFNGNTTLYGAGSIRKFEIVLYVKYPGNYNCISTPEYSAYGLFKHGSWYSWFRRVSNVLGIVLSVLGLFIKALSNLGGIVSLVELVVEFKSITHVSVSGSCYGAYQYYTLTGSNTGWDPSDFENAIVFKLTDALNPWNTYCASVGIDHIHITTDKGVTIMLPVKPYASTVCINNNY